MLDAARCPVCTGGTLHALIQMDNVPYLRCDACGTILAERGFLDRTMAGLTRPYDSSYWANEISAAKERGYGASLIRLAEVFLYARRPIRRFLDVSCGAGTLLDASAELMPEIANIFWGIEPFPPPIEYRSRHLQYRQGFLSDLEGRFDGGTCIEVIEHLPPPILKRMLVDLAGVSEPGALWYFNSAQPEFVLSADPGYLDPHLRGHIASYSIKAMRHVAGEAGFTVHALPGRDWALLLEYGAHSPQDSTALLARLWTMLPENRATLESARFGRFLLASGLEGARCYLESSVATWATGELRSIEARPLALQPIAAFWRRVARRFRR